MQYLTNHDPSGYPALNMAAIDHDTMAFMVYVAAIRSGQNVKYLNCPMPYTDGDIYYHRAVCLGAFNHFGCIVGIDDEGDYSRFWREYEKLENENEA